MAITNREGERTGVRERTREVTLEQQMISNTIKSIKMISSTNALNTKSIQIVHSFTSRLIRFAFHSF